jgi:anthranilate phosphoribosyltransferase
MEFIPIIKEIGRGRDGARDLSRDTARALYATMLRDEVPALELGGILIALRMKGEASEELAGFLDAVEASYAHLRLPAGGTPIVIPSYNGARKLPNLTPLLALLLAKSGVPVLMHGVSADPAYANPRVTSAEILAELGFAPSPNVAAAETALAERGLAFLPIDVLAPALSRLLQVRARLGVRNAAHTLAKMINPFAGRALQLVSVTHPDFMRRMREYFPDSQRAVLLTRGVEGEVVASVRRQTQIDWLFDGEQRVLLEADNDATRAPAALPAALDARTTADWIERVVAGDIAVPQPIARQIACCKEGLELIGGAAALRGVLEARPA